MKLEIDPLDSAAGWSVSGSATFMYPEVTYPEYISNGYSAALAFKLSEGGLVRKSYSPAIDVTDYDELVINYMIRDFNQGSLLRFQDYILECILNSSTSFFLPVRNKFSSVVLDISGVTSIDRLRFLHTSDQSFNVCMSGLYAVKDEYPLDILEGVKAGVRTRVDIDAPRIELSSTVTALAGSSSITLADIPNWVERYAVIQIDDGTNSEIHQIDASDGFTLTFTGLYDGSAILNTYTDAAIYLYFPVEFGRRIRTEIAIPGISIWGFVPVEEPISSDVELLLDTFGTHGDAKERRTGKYYTYNLIIDCEAKQDSILAKLSKAVQKFIGRGYVWINNQKYDIFVDSPPVEIGPDEHFQPIAKIQYSVQIRIKEELWQRENLYKASSTDLTINIQ